MAVPPPLPEVALEPITARNWRLAVAVEARADQLRFVADHQPVALVVLAKSYVRPGGHDWRPFAIVWAGVVVGVVALVVHQPPATCQVVHLVIDRRMQGRGLGAAGVDALIRHVRTDVPGCERLELTVHPDNDRARGLYERAGFHATGARADGEPVLVLDLHAAPAA